MIQPCSRRAIAIVRAIRGATLARQPAMVMVSATRLSGARCAGESACTLLTPGLTSDANPMPCAFKLRSVAILPSYS